jgi:hypothetical protein
MRRIAAMLVMLTTCASGVLIAQNTGDFRSFQTGDWNDVNTWERFDGSVWVNPAPSTPTDADGAVAIQGGDTVTVGADVSVDQVTIAAGGMVAVDSGYTLTIADGADMDDMSVEGTLWNAGTVTPTGVLSFGNGGLYQHSQNAGTIPTSNWGTGSTCEITGAIGNSPGNANQDFYHFVWNCPGQTSNLNLAWDGNTIGGNLTCMNSGSSRFQMTNNTLTGTTITINGDVIVTGGTLTSNGSSGAATYTIVVGGNVNVTGGNLSTSRGSGGNATWDLMGDFSVSNATLQTSNSSSRFVFAGSGVQNVTLTDVSFTSAVNFEVNSGSTMRMKDTSAFRGSGSFTLNAGATMETEHPDGINGNLQNSGTNTLSTGGSFGYVGAVAQATGSLLPDTVDNLRINNSAGVGLSGGVTIDGVLTLENGNITTGGDTVHISATGSVARTNGHIDGNLEKHVPPGTGVTAMFEIGSGSDYTPVTVGFAAVSSEGHLLALTTAGDHPNLGTSGIDPAKSVNRFWTLTDDGILYSSYDATFTFVPGDLDAGVNTDSLIAQQYSGGWSDLTVGTRTPTSVEVTGLTGFSDFALGETAPPPPILSNGTGGGDWNEPATWQGGIVPTSADSVVILGTDSVFVLADTACGGLAVLTGGKLGLAAQLAPTNVTVNGKVVVHADTLNPSGATTVGDGGWYQHDVNGGKIPTSTWETGSTCEITGAVGNSPQNANQNFYHFIWNCAGQTSNLNLAWDGITIGGNVTCMNSGSSRFQMTNNNLSGTTITITGDVIVTGGTLTSNGSSGAATYTIVVGGNVNVTGGNLSTSRGSGGNATWNLMGDFSIANATLQTSNSSSRFVFAGSGVQNVTLTDVSYTSAINFEVNGGSTMRMIDTSAFHGSGSFTLNDMATMETEHPDGINGNLQNSGTDTLSIGASFGFVGSTAQVTGDLLPDSVRSLRVNNSSGVTLSSGTTIFDILSVEDGHLDLNGQTVVLGPSGMLDESPGNTVNGTAGLIMTTRDLSAPSDTANIAGLGVKIGSASNLGSTVIARGHGVQTAGSGSIKRFFDITPTNNTGLNATLHFQYDDSELNGAAEGTLQLFRSTDSGSSWSPQGGAVDTASDVITLAGVNEFSRWSAAAAALPPLPAQVTLVAPAHGATINADTALCVWNLSTPAVTNYWFERATDSVFTNSLVDSTLTDTSVVTRQLLTNTTYWWRVKAKNAAGWGPFSSARRFAVSLTGVAEEMNAPVEFRLYQNYPNPFNPETQIRFSVATTGPATLTVFNALGQQVATLFNEVAEVGRFYVIRFSGRDLASGFYFYRLQSGGQTGLKKLLLVK